MLFLCASASLRLCVKIGSAYSIQHIQYRGAKSSSFNDLCVSAFYLFYLFKTSWFGDDSLEEAPGVGATFNDLEVGRCHCRGRFAVKVTLTLQGKP